MTVGSGCVTTPTGNVAATFTATGVAFLEERQLPSEASPLSSGMMIEATGRGLPASSAETPIQKKLTAQEAAKYRAIAGLLEKIAGLNISREGLVRDMAFISEEVSVDISGELGGIRVVNADYDEDSEIAEITVRVSVDNDGKVVPEIGRAGRNLSLAERMARAEEAARISAIAALREAIGSVHITQETTVMNLVLNTQVAEMTVEGWLQGAELSQPHWSSRKKCIVEGTVTLSPAELEQLRAIADASAL
ncbi:MAG: hypothetical protein O3A51_13730 [Verrucomicrobia bacterium]|nr:hypothetical protein [Verrucomicrobiota bacterium]